MQFIHQWLKQIDSLLGGSPWFVYLLLGTGFFFTLLLRFPQIRFFFHAWRSVGGRYERPGMRGDTSPFQALATALSGTVGTGNIAGVALAVHLGGPAAIFWMVVTAVFGMTTKLVEVTLSHKHRKQLPDGTMSGGPMYYMKYARFSILGRRVSMVPLALLFAVATIICSLGTGNLPQINSIASAVEASTGIERWMTGLVLAVLLALVIIGGIKRIAAVTSRLVPFMAVIYLIGAFSVILFHYENIIPGLQAIFGQILSGSAAVGGFLGASVAFTFQKGVGRGLFSNEAGQGSSPIAHASARGEHPVSEGIVSLLEPFIDTVIICVITGITLLASGVWKEKYETPFQQADLLVLDRLYNENNTADRKRIFYLLNDANNPEQERAQLYNGEIRVIEGRIQDELSILHARSLAEDVRVLADDPEGYSGSVFVRDGKMRLGQGISLHGRSLLHSAPLTMKAFASGWFGDWGRHIVTFGLLLFAFSTAVSWSYYGDRATIFLLGSRWILPYRILFVSAFFVGSFADTTVIWTFASVAIALMTIPNLVCLLWLRKQVVEEIKAYGTYFKKNFPKERHPRF